MHTGNDQMYLGYTVSTSSTTAISVSVIQWPGGRVVIRSPPTEVRTTIWPKPKPSYLGPCESEAEWFRRKLAESRLRMERRRAEVLLDQQRAARAPHPRPPTQQDQARVRDHQRAFAHRARSTLARPNACRG